MYYHAKNKKAHEKEGPENHFIPFGKERLSLLMTRRFS